MSMGDGYGGGYQGFVAGVFSGITKLAVGHPFDTIKVRMQTNPAYRNSLDCLIKTLRYDGVRGLYKGASPPLVGWMFMDSVTMGALTNYRSMLKTHVWPDAPELPLSGKLLSAVAAGWTVSFVATPVEHIKARLQVQYNDKAGTKLYTGPLDCAAKLIRQKGIFKGLYHGLFATMVFRTNFIFWWGTYDILSAYLSKHTDLSKAAISFWSGGLGATMFWVMAYPTDVVKQQILIDNLDKPKYRSWMDAARGVYRQGGRQAFTRGFPVSFIRSFPTNASALAAFELVMSVLHGNAKPDERLTLEVE
uniref:Mitochondrial MC24 n=1 Tax=Starmerella bombicola TaxID=75736 RepID=A0A6M8YDP6_STABO|nr:mitochondrial MC24 [Starmerella bombicola]